MDFVFSFFKVNLTLCTFRSTTDQGLCKTDLRTCKHTLVVIVVLKYTQCFQVRPYQTASYIYNQKKEQPQNKFQITVEEGFLSATSTYRQKPLP